MTVETTEYHVHGSDGTLRAAYGTREAAEKYAKEIQENKGSVTVRRVRMDSEVVSVFPAVKVAG